MIKIFLSRGHTEVLAGTPLLVITHITNVRKQKRRGSMYLSALIPNDRLLHCPLMRISNVKPAHAERYI